MMRAPGLHERLGRESRATSASRSCGRSTASYETRPDGSWSGQGGVRADVQAAAHAQHRDRARVHARARRDAVRARRSPTPPPRAMYGRRYVFGALDQTEFVDGDARSTSSSARACRCRCTCSRCCRSAATPASRRRRSRAPTTSAVRPGHRHDHASTRRTARTRSSGPGGTGTPFVDPEPRLQLHVAARQHGLPLGVQARLDALRRLDAAARGRDDATGASPSTRTSRG